MKKAWMILVAVFLLACACPLTRTVNTPAPETSTSPPVTGNLTLKRLRPAGGDLGTQLHQEASSAAALGQHMFVEFDASW